ncbi:hypothetical protein D6D01_06651 [Aureobasidium pullulans]|uniref:DUF1989 domain-containing protein n=1 Tax=Aureobasidium pullulans TaxID=5580 RepID=A0A4S9KX98_AURPU|nr:hypothetical protein D6D01_06651 [Aureobasidium pullulans]
MQAFKIPPTSPLFVDRELYDRIAKADRTLIEDHIVPPRSGWAWKVPAGSICRITCAEGAQIGDLNIWNAHNPKEHLWTNRSKQFYSAHLTIGDRLVSNIPYLRPLVTITGDSLHEIKNKGSWGVHDILGTRSNALLGGEPFDYHCHSNLVRAILPFGLSESDVHDNVNIFQITDLDEQGRYRLHPSPAKKGDYFEMFAEIDLLFALSTCPAGDESTFGWDAEKMKSTCLPLQVLVFTVEGKDLEGWKRPVSAQELYKGMHGLRIPVGEDH